MEALRNGYEQKFLFGLDAVSAATLKDKSQVDVLKTRIMQKQGKIIQGEDYSVLMKPKTANNIEKSKLKTISSGSAKKETPEARGIEATRKSSLPLMQTRSELEAKRKQDILNANLSKFNQRQQERVGFSYGFDDGDEGQSAKEQLLNKIKLKRKIDKDLNGESGKCSPRESGDGSIENEMEDIRKYWTFASSYNAQPAHSSRIKMLQNRKWFIKNIDTMVVKDTEATNNRAIDSFKATHVPLAKNSSEVTEKPLQKDLIK